MAKITAQIISIGDELLLGETINTNASMMSRLLNKIGVEVQQVLTISDEEEQIKATLDKVAEEADIVLMTGGLGPTNDDRSQKVLCELTQDKLVEDQEVLSELKSRYERMGRRSSWDVNKAQALVPSRAKVFINYNGTAPALWIKYKEAVLIALPGVPHETQAFLEDQITPYIKKNFDTPAIYYRTLLTYGQGESKIMSRILNWENNLPAYLSLAYLPSYAQVRLRVTGRGEGKNGVQEAVDKAILELKEILSDIAVGIEEETNIVQEIKKAMIARNQHLAVAESCTGGALASAITQESGVSAFFKGALVTYATKSKINLLDVPAELIEKHSVVSAEVAKAMAEGVAKVYNTEYAIATTGEAGPNKGDSNAPIGTVYIALKSPVEVKVERFSFGEQRRITIKRALNAALTMLWKEF